MSGNREVANNLMVTANHTIMTSRPGIHGSAEQSFQMIADLWTVYLNHVSRVRDDTRIRPEDVAQMMSMLKKARAVYGDVTNDDNFVDDLGYTALAGMLQLPDIRENPEREREPDPVPQTEPYRADGGADIKHKHTDITGQTKEFRPLVDLLGELQSKGVE